MFSEFYFHFDDEFELGEDGDSVFDSSEYIEACVIAQDLEDNPPGFNDDDDWQDSSCPACMFEWS